jgi:hypothetical protein
MISYPPGQARGLRDGSDELICSSALQTNTMRRMALVTGLKTVAHD